MATARSYALDLLRWFRFLWTVEVGWDRATRIEARDFCRWLQVAGKPVRPHWRHQAEPPATTSTDAFVWLRPYQVEMAEDPGLPLTDVQSVLGHAQLTTTEIYLTPARR